jgi:hypothetical protein
MQKISDLSAFWIAEGVFRKILKGVCLNVLNVQIFASTLVIPGGINLREFLVHQRKSRKKFTISSSLDNTLQP